VLQQLIKIVGDPECRRLVKALIGPLAELRASLAAHTEANGQDDEQAVVGYLALACCAPSD
jgi:hypothetical protein